MLIFAVALTGCESIDAYATEHNFKGERVCNTDLPRESVRTATSVACPVGPFLTITGDTQNEQESTQAKEEAL